jgi:hypothetical protein
MCKYFSDTAEYLKLFVAVELSDAVITVALLSTQTSVQGYYTAQYCNTCACMVVVPQKSDTCQDNFMPSEDMARAGISMFVVVWTSVKET